MIDEKTKMKFIKELNKEGNVFVSCAKVGIDRTTPYRWAKKDKKFSKDFKEAARTGRANTCDIAEHMLMNNIKKGKMEAIKYHLSHNSPRHKPKNKTKVTIEHKKITDPVPEQGPLTWEDLVDDYKEHGTERALELKEELTRDGKEIPNKPDGSPIELHDLHRYKQYIYDWQKYQEKKRWQKEQKKLHEQYIKLGVLPPDTKTPASTDTADSESSKDKPEAKPQENHKTQDTSHSDPPKHHTPPGSNK